MLMHMTMVIMLLNIIMPVLIFTIFNIYIVIVIMVIRFSVSMFTVIIRIIMGVIIIILTIIGRQASWSSLGRPSGGFLEAFGWPLAAMSSKGPLTVFLMNVWATLPFKAYYPAHSPNIAVCEPFRAHWPVHYSKMAVSEPRQGGPYHGEGIGGTPGTEDHISTGLLCGQH